MGGKKKTKWRKLPLDEFTNDCSKLKRRKSLDESKLDAEKKEENNSRIPTRENVENSSFPCNPEYAENPDAMWYPTHYLVFNPVEVPMYTNFAVPADSNCYYYPPTELNPAPEYASLPYQEYIPTMKDTVFLLFPASALRPPQYSSFDWRNRRRRRRYNGYAEYAVIPEKTSDEIKCSEKKSSNPHTEQNNTQQSQNKILKLYSDKKDISEIENKSLQDLESKKEHFKSPKTGELKDNMVLPNDEKSMLSSKKSKRIADACEVHNNLRKNLNGNDLPPNKDPVRSNSFDSEIMDKKNQIPCTTPFDIVVDVPCKTPVDNDQREMKDEIIKENSKNIDTASFDDDNSIKHTNKKSREVSPVEKNNFDGNITNRKIEKQSDDIRHKTEFYKHTDCSNGKNVENIFTDTNSPSSENGVDDPEPKTSHIPSQLKSLSQPQNFNSDYSKPNNIPISQPFKSVKEKAHDSIYKLSYAESLTDRSGSESRSVSPINNVLDPKFYIPKSFLSDEIVVYDGGSDMESGPEDLEVNPHIYESSHSKKSRYLYENELSLAVELLRTKESLPYDDEFKKIVENSVEADNESEENSLPPLEDAITNQCRGQHNMSIFHNPFDDICSSCELALDAKTAGFKGFEDDETDAPPGFRRSAAQFIRHYFSPCSVDSCCIIM